MLRVVTVCALAFSLTLLAACTRDSSAQGAAIAEQWRAIDLNVEPVELGVEQIGRLRFRGGLALTSDYAWFGGFSGIEVLDGERFIIISDSAEWFEGRFVLDDDGALVGIAGFRVAAMRNERGEPYDTRANGDSEALTQLPDGRFAVSFEQLPRIMIYDLNRDGPFGAATRGPRLDGVARLPPNASLEALAVDAHGALVVGAEGGGGDTPIWRAPLDARAPVESSVAYPLWNGYSLTSLDRAPDGGFFALERFYAPVIGARARISFFPDTGLDGEAGVITDVETLATLAPPLLADNFEAIAAVRRSDGGLRLYIASDDNFSSRQRTLIYAFDVVSGPSPR